MFQGLHWVKSTTSWHQGLDMDLNSMHQCCSTDSFRGGFLHGLVKSRSRKTKRAERQMHVWCHRSLFGAPELSSMCVSCRDEEVTCSLPIVSSSLPNVEVKVNARESREELRGQALFFYLEVYTIICH